MFSLHSFLHLPLIIIVSLGWVPWDGPLGVGFCAGLLSKIELDFHANTGRIGRTLARVSAGRSVVFSGAIKSPTVMDFV
ncbi:hypothetical protein V1477_020230 [Vespula maculifrons]|uniref:Secreted protein n=1 Tax=Vespula maculifrons TaxID=7453 RepID=A0ABD2ALJ7_VESMC